MNDAGGEKETLRSSKREFGMSPPAHDCALVLSDTEPKQYDTKLTPDPWAKSKKFRGLTKIH